jgi:hypothetical protein
MARGLPALLLLLLALALPAGAGAASRTVKMKLPADGGLSLAQYRVTTAAPGKAVIRNARRLGDAKVVVSARRVRGRRYQLTVLALNPRSGASAAQTDTAISILLLTSRPAPIAVAKTGAAGNVLTEPQTAKESSAVRRICARPRGRGRSRFVAGVGSSRRRMRVLFTPMACQDRTQAETLAARAGLESLGAAVPGCFGTSQRYQDSATEVLVRAICATAARVVNIQAPTGNTALNCLAPSGASCACGPFCAPFPPESGCFNDSDNFALNTPLDFRVEYEQPVQPRDITAIWVPQGSPVTDGEFAYLRYLLEAP